MKSQFVITTVELPPPKRLIRESVTCLLWFPCNCYYLLSKQEVWTCKQNVWIHLQKLFVCSASSGFLCSTSCQSYERIKINKLPSASLSAVLAENTVSLVSFCQPNAQDQMCDLKEEAQKRWVTHQTAPSLISCRFYLPSAAHDCSTSRDSLPANQCLPNYSRCFCECRLF